MQEGRKFPLIHLRNLNFTELLIKADFFKTILPAADFILHLWAIIGIRIQPWVMLQC